MKLLRLLGFGDSAGKAVIDDVKHTIDFAPVNGAASARSEKKKIAQARRRHGKEFITAAPVQRIAPTSYQLQELNRKSKAAKAAKAAPASPGSVTELRRKS